MEIRRILKGNQQDLNLKNEPFPLYGRVIPALENGKWSCRVEESGETAYMTFPDEDYDFDALSQNSVIFGAYEGDTCLGIAIFQDYYFKYMYLYDLKVCSAARKKGVGRALIGAGMEAARERGYFGIYTQAQDNNVNACKFYLSCGFEIGGFDNRLYEGTPQEDKADIFFYLKEK